MESGATRAGLKLLKTRPPKMNAHSIKTMMKLIRFHLVEKYITLTSLIPKVHCSFRSNILLS
jgi:hypothetical protein